jgi:thiamine transport system permease protein
VTGQPQANRLGRGIKTALVAPPVLFLALFYVWPFATLLARGLDLDAAEDVLGNRQTWDVVWFTTWQALASTLLTLVVGFGPAYVIARFEFPGRRLLSSLLMAVFVLPTVVVAGAFLALLPDSLDRSVWAILAAHVTFNLAVVVRTVGAVWEHLPTDLEGAAATLGASPGRVVREITLPLLRPALIAAGTIVFLFTFTSFGVVRVLGGAGMATIEVEVWRRATQLGEIDTAAVLTVLQLAALGIVVAWSAVLQRRHSRALALRPLARRLRPRSGRQRLVVFGVAALTALLVMVPLFALFERSTRSSTGHSLDAWINLGNVRPRRGASVGVDPVGALGNSLRAALLATTIAVVVGGVAALAIATAERGGRLLDTGLMLPLGTSAVTIGFGMLITFDTPPVDWRAEPWIVPVGHALVAVPFVVRSTLGVLRAVDPKLSEAAATLGASPGRAWRGIVVPHLWRPLAVGAGLAAAISLGEFGATSFLSRSNSETVPIAIEKLLSRTGATLQARGYALSVILAVATIVVVALVEWGGERARRA